MKNTTKNMGSFATAKLQVIIRRMIIIALTAIIGLAMTACPTESGGESTSAAYTSWDDVTGDTIRLVVNKAGKAARYAPSDGDTYIFTITSPSNIIVEKSTGTVVSFINFVFTLSQEGGGNITTTVAGSAIKSVGGSGIGTGGKTYNDGELTSIKPIVNAGDLAGTTWVCNDVFGPITLSFPNATNFKFSVNIPPDFAAWLGIPSGYLEGSGTFEVIGKTIKCTLTSVNSLASAFGAYVGQVDDYEIIDGNTLKDLGNGDIYTKQ